MYIIANMKKVCRLQYQVRIQKKQQNPSPQKDENEFLIW